MHPYLTEVEMRARQQEFLRLARAAHRPSPAARRPEPARRLRTTLGFWLVGLGLRLVVPEVAR